MPIFTMLIGIPGSGKSNWIKHNKMDGLLDNFIICPDEIRKTYFTDISNQDNNEKVWDIAKGMTIATLLLGKNVILDATNVNTKYRRDFLSYLPVCTKKALLFTVDPQVAASRVKDDIDHGLQRSNVPIEIIFRMYGEFLYTKTVIYDEGFDHIAFAFSYK